MTTKNQYYEQMLQSNICKVTLTHNQTISCTLMQSLIPVSQWNQRPRTLRDTIQVWNLDKKSWMGFQPDQIKSFKLVTNNLAEAVQNKPSRPARSEYAAVRPSTAPATFNVKQAQYISMLESDSYTVTFTKTDGSTRVMNVSLQADVLKKLGFVSQQTNPDVIKVVDIDINQWRTIKVANIISMTKYENPVVPTASTDTIRAEYSKALREGECNIVFVKMDNTQRTMRATLNSEMIDKMALPSSHSNRSSKKQDNNVIAVVDLDLGEWRTFRIDRVITFERVKRKFTTLTAA